MATSVQPLFVEFLPALRRLEGGDRRRQTGVLRGGRNLFRERKRERRNLTRGTTQAMIRHRARQSKTILDHVEAIHRVLRRAHPTTRRKGANCRQIAVTAIKEIAVERENNIRAIKPGDEPRIFAKTHMGGEALRFGQQRVIHAPAHLRENLLQLPAQTFARRRMHFLDQKRETRPAISRNLRAKLREIFLKGRPIARLEVFDFLAALFFSVLSAKRFERAGS